MLLADVGDGMIITMRRDRTQQATPQLADMAGSHRILVTIPDRLGKSNEALCGIASVVASAA